MSFIWTVNFNSANLLKHLKQSTPTPKAFLCGTGLMGSTEPGQRVTKENAHELPSGSVVRLGDGARLIHLHDDIWLYCADCCHTYDRLENLLWRIDAKAVACHVAPE